MENNNELQNIVFPIVIKRSPAQLALQISTVLFFSLLLFIIILVLGNFISNVIQIPWLSISLATIAVIVLIFVNIVAIITAFLKWSSEYYEIHENEIVFARGIISKKRRSFPLDKVETMNVSQNFIERTFDFGDVTLLNPILPSNRRMDLIDIPHPQKYLDIIKKVQEKLVEGSPRKGHTIYTQYESGSNGRMG